LWLEKEFNRKVRKEGVKFAEIDAEIHNFNLEGVEEHREKMGKQCTIVSEALNDHC